MAKWVMDNLGLHKDLSLDRIDNDGPYAAGNLRYATQQMQVNNESKPRVTAELHAFRIAHPEVKYADATLRDLIGKRRLSWKEIVERFNRPSNKPKGVYGTFLTPDPAIASLSKGF